MTLEVLHSEDQIRTARRQLKARGLSYVTPSWKRFLHRYSPTPKMNIGDELKSWDMLKTVEFVERHARKNDAILDLGAFGAELPFILHALGFSGIVGVDLNPDVVKMPLAGAVRYEIGDFMHTGYADDSFSFITAISVIEHGFKGEALAAELGRLLRPGGHFIASFDYWPDKVSTDGVNIFGMSWTIFSKLEVEQFIAMAKSTGLVPYGPLEFSAGDKPISCFGRDYTFAWIVLQKQ